MIYGIEIFYQIIQVVEYVVSADRIVQIGFFRFKIASQRVDLKVNQIVNTTFKELNKKNIKLVLALRQRRRKTRAFRFGSFCV